MNMAVLNWFGSLRCVIKKEIVPITSVRGLCSQAVGKRTKAADLYILPAEREKIDLETKLRYMKSKAYKTTYGDLPVWTVYVRNFKGGFAPKPRKSCILYGALTSRNPCPICRDKYLVAHYRNVDLLKQFISPYGAEIISNRKTGVCQLQQFNLIAAIQKAMDMGLLSYPVPFRSYDYSSYQK